jgi:predicted dehydrogenase
MAHVADRGQEQHLVLHGEGGTLELDVAFAGTEEGAVIRGARHDEDRFETFAVPEELWGGVDPRDMVSTLTPRGLRGLFAQRSIGDRLFIDAILEGGPASPSFYDGWKAQQVIDAAIESHCSGSWISLQ